MHAVAVVTLALFLAIALLELMLLRHLRPLGAPAEVDAPEPAPGGAARYGREASVIAPVG
jgi:hypothetical protein